MPKKRKPTVLSPSSRCDKISSSAKRQATPASTEPTLSWRMDPVESLSDWTIHVVHIGTGKAAVYHVHKVILAVGPRKSEYFSGLFRSASNMAESEKSTSRIELEEPAAEAFPHFLDYFYAPTNMMGVDLEINTHNATGLQHLSDRFQASILADEVQEFWKHDLELATIATYYKDAALLQEQSILAAVENVCVRNIMNIQPCSPILEIMEPTFLERIVSNFKLSDSAVAAAAATKTGEESISSNDEEWEDDSLFPSSVSKEESYEDETERLATSSHLSLLIAEYCRKKRLDVESFSNITCEQHLPEINLYAAPKLMEAEDSILGNNKDSKQRNKNSSTGEVSSLKRRCLEAMARSWHEIDVLGNEQLSDLLCRQPSGALVEFIGMSFRRAKHQMRMANQYKRCRSVRRPLTP